jgi:hypothetical protein
MINWKGFGRKRSWPVLRYYPGIRLEGPRKTSKPSIRIAGRRGRDLNPGPPEYEGVLATRPRRSMGKADRYLYAVSPAFIRAGHYNVLPLHWVK